MCRSFRYFVDLAKNELVSSAFCETRIVSGIRFTTFGLITKSFFCVNPLISSRTGSENPEFPFIGAAIRSKSLVMMNRNMALL